MTFTESIKTCLITKFCNFRGRASRSEFWWFYLFQVLVTTVCGVIMRELASVCSLVFLLPNLGALVRRLHDRNHSGWWVCLPLVFGGAASMAVYMGHENSGLLFLGIEIVTLLIFVVFLCLKGTPIGAPNRYGPAPYVFGESAAASTVAAAGAPVAAQQPQVQPQMQAPSVEPASAAGAAPSTVFCEACGAPAKPGDKFCRSCGRKF